MNELNSMQLVAKALCLSLDLDDESTERYLEAARECYEYFEDGVQIKSKMASQLIKESPGHSLLSALLNHIKLSFYGTQIPMPSESIPGYYSLVLAYIVLSLGAYYVQGYNDAISMESPELFEDFISDLGPDDSSE